uniref:NADH-ubiquinone oxidoreductase chain 2 n=1 Tax=Achatinella mustelina TaxID=115943 RepID=A0A2Z1P6R9_9EUPU|nr:NADH dehydrogenase subunit 2 [Achatinella mustelina]ANC62890.1 NADH dehydrogenase subunit 2 [Achatinella mustelina]
MLTMYYIIFIYVVLLAPFLSISSSNWLILWVLMEINLFSIMPLFTKSKSGSMLSESMMKYFVVQAVASLILMVSGINLYMNLMFEENNNIYWLIFSMMVFLKLGIFPLSFWVIPVLKGVNSFLIFFLLGPMKIVPLYLMYFHLNFYSSMMMKWMFYIIIGVSSMIVGALVGNNMTEFRMMIGASSITHSGWFVIASTVSGLLVYFFLYMVSLSFLLISLMSSSITTTALTHCMMMLSLSGLPPFLLFYAKYLVFSNMLLMQMSLVFIMIVLFSAILSLNVYLKFSYNFILNYVKNKTSKMKKDIIYMLIFIFLSLGTSIMLLY